MVETTDDWGGVAVSNAAPAQHDDWGGVPINGHDTQPSPQSFTDKLMQTWPVKAAKSVYDAVTVPGDVASGKGIVAPSKPGWWSDEDEARQQATNSAIVDRITNLAAIASPVSVAARAGEGILGAALAPKQNPTAAPTIQELKKAATGPTGYKAPEVQAVQLKPEVGPKIADEITANFNSPELGIDEIVAPKTFGVLKKLYDVPDESFMTVNNLRSLRRTLGNVAASPDATERLAAKSAQQHIDEYLSNLTGPDVISGDPKAAAEILKKANANYSAMMHAADLDTRLTRAQLRASAANSGMNVGNTIRQRMADILVNPKLRRGFTGDELEQMQGIVEGSKSSNAMRYASNVLGGGGGLLAALYGLGHAAVAPVAGYALRKAYNAQTTRAAAGLNEAVRARSPLAQEQAAIAGQSRPSLAKLQPTIPLTAQTISPSIQLPAAIKAATQENDVDRPPAQQKNGGAINQQNGFAHGGRVRLSHEKVGYVTQSHKRNKKCSNCSMYIRENECMLVRAPISPDGLCRRFRMKR